MTRDARLLFAARAVRMFGYGSLAVILVLFLSAAGFDGGSIGLLLSLTLVGDTVVSLWLTEQASLSQVSDDKRRTSIFAWYNLTGSVATALGALATGLAVSFLRGGMSMAELTADRVVLLGYAGVGLILIPLFLAVSPAVEVPPVDTSIARRLGLHRSKGIVARLALLFSLDAFAGGFVIQSLLAFWFHTRFGVSEAVLGGIFFAANILAAVSALSAAAIARRIGLINTMVFTHLPSNVLLILVPLMPNLPLAILVLLARFSISQMDVPTRQSYTIAVVDPDERSAAAGVTGIARTTGAAVAPLIAAPLMAMPLLASLPFLLGGGLKIAYDLLLYRAFRSRPAPEEQRE